MKWSNFCVWILLNMMLMGMSGYMYLMWVQYWRYSQNSKIIQGYEGQSVNRMDDIPINFNGEEIIMKKGRPIIKPREIPTEEYGFIFPNYENKNIKKQPPKPQPTTTTTTTTTTTMSPQQLREVIDKHKMNLIVKLRRTQMEPWPKRQHRNQYGVKFHGRRKEGEATRKDLLCALKKVTVRGLRDGDEPFTSEGMGKYFLHQDILEGRYFNTCAVVSSAGSIIGSNNGKFIDSHDFVLRLNHAQIKGFEKDVGEKTDMRIINSIVVTKSEYDFWGSPLYRNITLLASDPSNYNSSLAKWYASPRFPIFSEFFRRRLMLPKEDLHLLDPRSLWRLWDTLQIFTRSNLRPSPPSTGFLGLTVMLRHCNWIDVFEYIPSIRITEQCHYWSNDTNIGCTYGGWHPMETEKLLSLVMNTASDFETFVKGYIRIPGFSKICDT